MPSPPPLPRTPFLGKLLLTSLSPTTRDVLKRHFLACRVRLDEGLDVPVLARGPRGKRRTACDRCNSLKRACSSSQPCEACARRNETCTYSHTYSRSAPPARPFDAGGALGDDGLPYYPLDPEHGDAAPRTAAVQPPAETAEAAAGSTGGAGNSWEPESLFPPPPTSLFCFDEAGLGCAAFPDDVFNPDPEDLSAGLFSAPLFSSAGGLPALPEGAPHAFQFMAQFAKFAGLVDSFECGSLSERQQLVGAHLLAAPAGGDPTGFAKGHPSPWGVVSFDLAWAGGGGSAAAAVDNDQLLGVLDPSSSWSGAGGAGEDCTGLIVSMLKEVTLNKARGSKIGITWSPAVEAACYQFFSTASLEKNLGLFWSCWHPNCPILHKPTFSPSRSSPALVASMAVMGACLSPSHTDRAHASIWFNSLEELIFQDEILLDDSISVSNGVVCGDEGVRRRLEMIQAAYFVCLVQYWEGSKPNKRRIRSHRYAAVLAASPQMLPPFLFFFSFLSADGREVGEAIRTNY